MAEREYGASQSKTLVLEICMNCLCGKYMTNAVQMVEFLECYPGGNYDTGSREEEGFICECGLFLGASAAVFNKKSYPYWKHDSDYMKKIMGIEE